MDAEVIERAVNQALIQESDLLAWTGYTRRADVERLLRRYGIPIIHGKNGQICTTLDALNSVILGKEQPDESIPEFR